MRGCQGDRGRVRDPDALAYLVGEKFLNFLEAAETHADFRAEIPAFVAEIKTIFEPWQLAEYLETARQTEPFDPALYDEDEDPEDVETDRQEDIRRSASDLLLVEQAKGWLLAGMAIDPQGCGHPARWGAESPQSLSGAATRRPNNDSSSSGPTTP